tara:strand:+ start:273 stop:677 length:405 start_codon:yes stop_codon:yes gene_type:complete
MTKETKEIIRAEDVMRQNVIFIDGMATAKEAAATMKNHQVYCLLVKKRHPDDAWGMVAVQDLVREVLAPGRTPEEVHVYEIMSKPVITVPAQMDIRYVARLLYRAGVRRAPVEDNGNILGMVSLSSLILENDLF